MLKSMSERKRRAKGKGGLTRRADGSWQGTFPYRDEFDCKRVKYFYGPTKTAVDDAIRDFKAGGCQVESRDDRTVGDLLDHLLGADGSKGTLERSGALLPSTIADYRSKVDLHVRPILGGARLRKLDVAMIDAVLLRLIESDKRRTALHVRYILCRLLNDGVRLRWIASNPAESAMAVSVASAKRRIYSLEQLRTLVDSTEDPRVKAWILLAGMAGLRESEIAGLMWAQLNGHDLTIDRQRHRAQTKTMAGTRVIRIPEPVLDAIRVLPRESLWLFPAGRRARKNVAKPSSVHPSTIYHRIQEAIAASGLHHVTVHDLRHSANNILKQLGIDAVTRRDILGHSSTSTTENVYSQTVDAELIDAAQRMNDAWSGKQASREVR